MRGWQLRVASLLLMLALSRVLEAAADQLDEHEDRAEIRPEVPDWARDQDRADLEAALASDGLEQPADVDDLDGDDLGVFSRGDLPTPPVKAPCGRCKRCRCGDRRHGGRR